MALTISRKCIEALFKKMNLMVKANLALKMEAFIEGDF